MSGQALRRRQEETGLTWGIEVGVRPESSWLRGSLLAAGLLALGLAGTLYLAYRVVRRELEVAKMQTEFVAAVSHEFRSPITALTHLTELLGSGGTPQERHPLYFAALQRETRRLHEMVENLLDFGRMEAGRYRYRPERIEAGEFVGAVVEEFRQQESAAGREIGLERSDGAGGVSADREALRRALWNLLDNAVKYSPAGRPVAVKVRESGGWVRMSVEDGGPGIAQEERKAIFQKFARGREAADGAVKGAGIGLALVEAIARAHGGRVELESTPGTGSCFTLVLPREGEGVNGKDPGSRRRTEHRAGAGGRPAEGGA